MRYLFGVELGDELDEYDLEDEGDRSELVERFLGLPEGAPQRGSQMVVRTVVANQVL